MLKLTKPIKIDELKLEAREDLDKTI
ncbi:hypothetical protein [Thermococcus barophilus]